MKLLNETDLRMQFKADTGFYPTYGNEHNIEKIVTDSNFNLIKYTKHLEEQLLQYKNAELVVEQANIEANTVAKDNADIRAACVGCEDCNCDE